MSLSIGSPIRQASSIAPTAAPNSWPIGSEVPFAAGLHLRAEAPLEGRLKLVRDGDVVCEQTGPLLDFPVDQPGIYRVEVWLNLAGEERPWILTNPIYVRKAK